MKNGDISRLAVLATVAQVGPIHGYELAGVLAKNGMGVEPATSGGLYRLMRQLADEGWVATEWATPETGPARRMYAITQQGVEHLQANRQLLHSYARALGKLVSSIPR